MKTPTAFRSIRGLAAAGARWAAIAAAAAVLAGCATGPRPSPADPFEPFNRGVYRFNEAVDDAVLKPVATAYQDVVPSMVRTGVNNFFGNLGEAWNFVNNVAQLKAQRSAESFMRLNVNTVFGLGGLLDIATEVGIERHRADFGQTLGYWGVPAGPYLMLPLLGPSTVRDTAVLPVDRWGDPLSHMNDVAARNSLTVLNAVDTRSVYLRVTRMLEDAALDKYSFTRDAYLQRRAAEVRDGAQDGDDERYDLDDDAGQAPSQ